MKNLKFAIAGLLLSATATEAYSQYRGPWGHGGGHHGGGYGRGGYGQPQAEVVHLQAECMQRRQGMYGLRFYGQQITSYRGAKAIPLKMLLSRNCEISNFELKNVESVTLVASVYANTKVTLLSNNYESRPQFLSMRNTDRYGMSTVMFNLRYSDSLGKLQLLIDGDIDIQRIMVRADTFDHRIPDRGPVYKGPRHGGRGHGRGPIYDAPRGPGRGPIYDAPRGPGRGPIYDAPRGPGRGPVVTPPRGRLKTQSITCKSQDKKFSKCSVQGAVDVQLTKRISDARCVKGYSFGVLEGQGIWVDDGCRGVFEVTYK